MSSGGRKFRQKGDRIEREIVARHEAMGVKAERYPLSGASRFRGSGHDVDVYALGADEAPLVSEVKGRKDGQGFGLIERWLGEYDILFLRRNNADPLVVLPWSTWQTMLRASVHQSVEIKDEARSNRLIRDDLGLFSKRSGRRTLPVS
jgi:Holliday junction resolvase